MRFFVTTSKGLEPALIEELDELGLEDRALASGGVHVRGTDADLVRLNVRLATALRVLVPLRTGLAEDGDELYDLARGIDWPRWIEPDGTLWVRVSGRGGPGLSHTGFVAQRVKDAVVDSLREATGERPSVDRDRPDLALLVHLADDSVRIALDSSGDSLHRRGYRTDPGEAALRETIAAAVTRLAGWRPGRRLIDLTCGSGTVVIEAARRRQGIAPGGERDFVFPRWPEAEEKGWTTDAIQAEREAVRSEALAGADDAPLLGFDSSADAIATARDNARRAGVHNIVRFESRRLEDTPELELGEPGDLLFSNPPWGDRLGEVEDLRGLYGAIGDVFKTHGAGWTGAVLTGNTKLGKSVGLRTRRRVPLWTGTTECRLLLYELYRGSRKPGRSENDPAENSSS